MLMDILALTIPIVKINLEIKVNAMYLSIAV